MNPFTINHDSNTRRRWSRHPGPWLTVLGALLMLWTATPSSADPYDTARFASNLNYHLKNEHAEYVTIRWSIGQILASNRHNLVDWAAELLEAEPKNANEAMLKIDVLLRVGLDSHAAKVVRQLKSFYPDPTDPILIKNAQELFKTSWEEFHAFDTAFAVCETFPQHAQFASKASVSQVVDRLRLDKGWNKEKREQWLAKMESQTPRELVFGKARKQNWTEYHKIDHPGSVWFFLWFRTRSLGQERNDFISQLKADIEKHPDDSLKAYYFLVLWREISRNDKSRGDEPLWLAETVQPKTCRDAYTLARYILELKPKKPAVILFQRAKTLFEKAEKEPAASDGKDAMTPREKKGYKKAIERWLKQLDSLVILQPDDDATLFDPARFTRDPIIIRPDSSASPLSSTSTAASTAMKEKKPLGTDDPEYWWRKGESSHDEYRRTKSKEAFKKAEEAFKKGLEMTDPASWPADKKKRENLARVRGLLRTSYISILDSEQRFKDSFQLYLYDLKHAPPESQLAKDAVSRLAHGPFRDFLNPDDPILWNWLEKTPVWANREMNFLNGIATRIRETNHKFSPDNEAPESVYAYVERVEKMAMAKDADISRMRYCINMLSSGSYYLGIQPNTERTIPLLEKWLQRKDQQEDQRRHFAESLLSIYYRGNDIDKADALLEKFDHKLDHRETFIQIAQIAAQKDKKELAMKYWRRSANCGLFDADQIQLSKMLREKGLGGEIDAYYNQVKKKLPPFTPNEVPWDGMKKIYYVPLLD